MRIRVLQFYLGVRHLCAWILHIDLPVGESKMKASLATRLFLSLSLVLLVSFDAFSQNHTITGKVSDSKGEELIGVSVQLKNTTTGTTTNMNGEYSLNVPSSGGILVFTYIGFHTQENSFNANTSSLNVQLIEDQQALDEVVVVGYGTQKKETLTGSITTASGDDLSDVPVTNVSQTLSGRLSGVTAIARGGEPGSDNATIRIRGVNTLGDNSPLIVVDGIPGRSLERIDPSSIESLTVLKDASAAIYGSQAANGVVLITTKRGKAGSKPQVTVTLNQGYSQPTVIPRMLNSEQYATQLNEIDMYRGRTPRYTDEDLQLFRDGTDPWGHPNTDWFADVFKPWSGQAQANISIAGGSETMRYFTSLGAKTQDGYYKNGATRYNQYNFRSNLDYTVNENVSLGLDLVGRLEDVNAPGRGSTGTIMNAIMRGKPFMVAYWPTGEYGPDIERGENPAAMATDVTGKTRNRDYVVNTNLNLDIKIPGIEGLSVSGNAAFDKRFRFNKQFQKPWYLYSWDGVSYGADNLPLLVAGKKGINDPNLTESFTDFTSYLLNGLINYDKTFGDHQIKFLAGSEVRAGGNETFQAYRRYFISTVIDQLDAGGLADLTNGGTASHNARLNYFGRVNYNYQEKYLAEFVWRVDGSYIFPEIGRYGFFPGVSLGWRISEENFWKENLSFITDAKLRGSFGQTGNDRIAEWQYLSSYNISNTGYVFDISNENKTIVEARIPNPSVTWEVANQANIGIDAAFLGNKLTFSFDYFDNRRSQILWQRNASVPSSTGLSLPRENIGKLKNTGFDLSIGYNNNAGDLKYAVSVNGGYSKNEILFWDETPGVPDYQQTTGHPLPTSVTNPDNDLYYQAIGIFKDQAAVDAYPHWGGARPGDIIFKDVNNDGKINALDRVRSHYNDVPRWSGGLQFRFEYKKVTLSGLIQGQAGATRYLANTSWGGDFGNGLLSDFEGRWTPTNTDATKPRSFNREDEYFRSQRNTQYLFKTDFVRLKNLELGYSLPNTFVDKIGLQNFKVYASGVNLFTISPFKDFDPEDNSGGLNYPPSRVINFGISTTF